MPRELAAFDEIFERFDVLWRLRWDNAFTGNLEFRDVGPRKILEAWEMAALQRICYSATETLGVACKQAEQERDSASAGVTHRSEVGAIDLIHDARDFIQLAWVAASQLESWQTNAVQTTCRALRAMPGAHKKPASAAGGAL